MISHVQDAVNRKPTANGLAIIVANEHSVIPEHKHLPGARKDLDTMKQTFENLKFATLPILNPSRDELIQVIQAAVSTQLQYPKTPDPQAYSRLVFYVSGHGDQQYIYTYDGKVNLQKEVFPPFLPEKSPHLAKIPKLFFIDACRGSSRDTGIKIQVYPAHDHQFQSRGGGEERVTSIGNYLLACSTQPGHKAFENSLEGGYWTQELARELCNQDNIEMSVNDVLGRVNKRLIDGMKEFPSLQQPVLESTLIGDPIKLLKEAKIIESKPEAEGYFADPQHVIWGSGCYGGQDQELQLQQQELNLQCYQLQATMAAAPPMMPQGYDASYGSVSWLQSVQPQQVDVQGYATHQPYHVDGTASMQHHAHYPHQGDNGTLFPVTSLPMTTIASSGNPSVLYQNVPMNQPHYSAGVDSHQYASMAAASQPSAYQCYSSDPHGTMQNGACVGHTGTTDYQRHCSEPNVHHNRVPSQANLQGGNEQGYHRGLLNHFSQTGIISDYHDHKFTEHHDGSRTLYRSFLSLKHVETNTQITAMSQCLPSKSEAKEDAARDACKQIEALQQGNTPQIGRGGSETISGDINSSKHIATNCKASVTAQKTPQSSASQSSSSSSTKNISPTSKIWKQKLKEYFDKKLKGTGVASIRYESKESQKGGRFTAIVYCPEIGMAEGEKNCSSKAAAEHSAAYNALKKLNALPK